jgi:Leucine-rich repeat (LRR) protein
MKLPPRGIDCDPLSVPIDRNGDASPTAGGTSDGALASERAVRDVVSLRVQAKSLQESISPKAIEEQKKAAYFSGWELWASLGGVDGGDRDEAVRRMKATLQSHRPEPSLSLNNLGLTKLPDNLPSWLGRLDVANNKLVELPENLPHWLGKLDVSGNCLTTLPITLPAWLKELDASSNLLETLPESLPSGLVDLNVDHNRLRGFPEYLPSTLENIHASANRLRRLSDYMPGSLRQLNVDGNMLIALPKKLPAHLTHVNADDNALTYLPHTLPATLIQLVLDRNRLTTLPEYVASRLKHFCTVSLHGNPLSEKTRAYLQGLSEEASYRGPTFVFSRPDDLFSFPVRPLHAAVFEWYRELDEPDSTEARRAIFSKWQSFDSEDGASAFSHFLDGLQRTVSYGNELFRASIVDWLDYLGMNSDLRNKTFLASVGATENCQDRVSYTLNTMKQLRIEDDVARGIYDERIGDLLPLARGMFRLSTLNKIANQKILSLNLVDEIEACLAYQVKLRTVLHLPVDTPDMRFFDASYVTDDDLKDAENTVKVLEQSEFARYLSRWTPWQILLERVEPKTYAESRNRFLTILEVEFEDRLERRLSDHSLQGDEEAAIRLGPMISAEIEHEIMHALTVSTLSERGLAALLESPW